MAKNRWFSPTWLSPAWVLVLPIAYVIVYLTVGNCIGPYYWNSNQDPDYAYLLNSLLLARLEAPRHTDHPGTPLQALGAIVLWLGYVAQLPFNPALKSSLTADVLTHPELYLHLINAMLLFVTACLLIAVGWVALRLTRSLPLTLLLQITPLLMIRTFLAEELSRVAPDVLVVCVSYLMVIVLLRYLYADWPSDNQASGERSRAVSLGAVFGLGMATKVTFLTMALFLLLPQGWRSKAWAIGATLAAFVLATLPIITRYGRTFGWMVGVATHTGAYNSGDAGIVKASFGENAGILLKENSVFFIILFLATAACLGFAILWRFQAERLQTEQQPAEPGDSLRENGRPPDFRKVYFLLVLTTLLTWGQIALTLNEQPKSRYLNPAAGMIGFLVLLLVHISLIVLPLIGDRLNTFRVRRLVPAIALALCVAVSLQQIDFSADKIASGAKKRLNEINKIEAILQQDQYQSCAIVVSRRSSTVESALKFGDFWSGKQLKNELGNLYPDPVFYINQEKNFETYTRPVSLAALSEKGNGCVLLKTFSMPPQSGKAKTQARLSFEEIFEGKFEALYRIKTS
ncbi:MAG: DUF2029 domain-containing protein [Oscillatoriophycideae cyanobacterium NC_groundwater_1537_Pr4_S-0.65um_50_18]|nr:DUF2029 domain-containing protein [Oscillatoriophycideae cyanobacterium NC_groundwater_1537_Pr4_S-0.65um_50_18]